MFELRTKRGSNINRILFGVHENRVCILATSFVKKTQKTPRTEIELAERRLEEWRKTDE